MIFHIETRDNNLFSDLTAAIQGAENNVPENCIVKKPERSIEVLKAIGGIDAFSFIAGIGSGIAVNLLSNWLWEIIKGRFTSLQIANKPVEPTKRAIEIYITNIINKGKE